MRQLALQVLDRLENKGYEAYLVGGSVRDDLLGLDPLDFDVATSARPEEIKEVFKGLKQVDVGKAYGTIRLVFDKGQIEVTSFRTEGDYRDSRHPGRVHYTKDLKEDLKRRDFTINALAQDRQGRIYDYFSGQEDLEEGILRTVGDPEVRIKEDALRILRAFRFAARFHLNLDLKLLEALQVHRDLLKKISKDRVREEFFKLLVTEDPAYGLYLMAETGVLKVLFPLLQKTVAFDQKSPFHPRPLFDHLLCVLNACPRDLVTRLGALFHDIGKVKTQTRGEDGRVHYYGHDKLGADLAGDILQGLKAPKDLIKRVQALIENHMSVQAQMSDKALRRQIRRLGQEDVLRLYDLLWADAYCTGGPRAAAFIEKRRHRLEDLIEEPIFQKKNFLAINGKDLLDLGFEQGPLLGQVLKKCEAYVLDQPERNTRDQLLTFVKSLQT